jgi:hypothetical protein
MIGTPDFQNMDQTNRSLRAMAYITQLITVVTFLAVHIALGSYRHLLFEPRNAVPYVLHGFRSVIPPKCLNGPIKREYPSALVCADFI